MELDRLHIVRVGSSTVYPRLWVGGSGVTLALRLPMVHPPLGLPPHALASILLSARFLLSLLMISQQSGDALFDFGVNGPADFDELTSLAGSPIGTCWPRWKPASRFT